ncbi:MAG: NAD(P)/FAD-dependent oxidoreductase [Alphaproteobacteria bacterium]|nr:NAD(P)/FAD-dependent oxidoreductase [Alphaproteobacteria bacterium]
MSSVPHIVVVGGGAAGITVSAMLRQGDNPPAITLVEPSATHYYQPLWTLVGGGVFPREESARPTADFIPDGVTWVQDKVVSFDPEAKTVALSNGDTLSYDYLVVSPGIQLDWHKIEGLEGHLGKDGICSNYRYDTVESTWKTLQGLKKGRAVFTYPSTPIKCAGAPQKIMWLTEHYLDKHGIRDKVEIVYASATADIFGVERYARSLRKLVAERDIHPLYKHDLVAVRPASKEAVFRKLDGGDEVVLSYDMLHVVPPMSAPDFVKQSPLADKAGWVEVDPGTLQHTRFPDVFSLGDACSAPNSKTAAAVRKQAPVVVRNLQDVIAGRAPSARYDGYASCPLVTGYGRLIMAEFVYGGVPAETLPYDQSKERYSLWALKAYALPRMYWHGMLRGRW